MKRRIVTILGGVLIALASLAISAAPAMAADGDDPGCNGSFLGLRPWYYGICKVDGGKVDIKQPDTSETGLAQFVWTIALNVLFDLSLAVGYLTLAMIVVGGYQYISSQGDPGKMAKGKKTLMTATIGTTIALSASVIINTASKVLSANLFSGQIQSNPITSTTINDILSYAYSMAGLVAVAFIIKGGFDYISSQGDPGKTAQGTRTLITAAVGLVIVILARIITGLILTTTGGAQ